MMFHFFVSDFMLFEIVLNLSYRMIDEDLTNILFFHLDFTDVKVTSLSNILYLLINQSSVSLQIAKMFTDC